MQPDVDPQYRSTLVVSFGFQELRYSFRAFMRAGLKRLYAEPVSSSPGGAIPLSKAAGLPLHRGLCILNRRHAETPAHDDTLLRAIRKDSSCSPLRSCF